MKLHLLRVTTICSLFAFVATAWADPESRPSGGVVATPMSCLVDDNVFSSAAGGCLQSATGITWSFAFTDRVALSVAKDFCGRLKVIGRLDDQEYEYTNWQLPSVEDLRKFAGEESSRRHIRIRGNDFFWTTSGLDSDIPEIPSRQTVVDLLTGEEDSVDAASHKAAFICMRVAKDADHDGVLDESDICNDTAEGASVVLDGPRKGCADGQQTNEETQCWSAWTDCRSLCPYADDDYRAHIRCSVECERFRPYSGVCEGRRREIP